MTWAQPPFYVHKMVADTWQPFAVNASVTPPDATRASAAVSGDGKYLVVRYVNDGGPDTVNVQVQGMAVQPTVRVWQLQADNIHADNTPASPTAVSPTTFTITLGPGPVLVPAQSFTVMLFTAQ
jgi:alpha-L-arabinofuranosidase